MRLAVFTNQFPGKVATFFARDVRALLENGLDIDVFALYPHRVELWKYVPEILNENQLSRDKVHHANLTEMLKGARLRGTQKSGGVFRDAIAITLSSARFGFKPVVKSVYSILQGFHWARKYAATYDHVLSYWANYSATSAFVFHRLVDRSIPYSVMIHAGTDLYRDQVYLQQKLLYADNIIVVCEFNKRFLKQKYPDLFPLVEKKIYIHHPGIDFAEYSWEPGRNSALTVVAVGKMTKVKGFDYLLRASEELKRRGVDIALELVGEGKEAGSLHALAAKLGISERVKFHGWLTPEQTRDVIARATLLVHPSSQLGDAVPTVIKEAMALGTPVIGTTVAGIPELLDEGKCGILVEPQNVSALAASIEKMLGDDVLRMNYSTQARRYAEEKFDLWKNGASLATILRSKLPPQACVS